MGQRHTVAAETETVCPAKVHVQGREVASSSHHLVQCTKSWGFHIAQASEDVKFKSLLRMKHLFIFILGIWVFGLRHMHAVPWRSEVVFGSLE